MNGASPMRYLLVPALMALLLSGCGDGDSGGAAQGGSGTGGNPAALAIVTSSLPNAIQNGYYYAQIHAAGGTAPYTWTLVGTPATGLSMTQSSGSFAVIEGVPPYYTWEWLGGAAPPPPPPNTEGAYRFALQVTDSAGSTLGREFLVRVDQAAASSVAVRGITDSAVGCEFAARFNAVGGLTGAYSWAVVSGAMPPGLALGNSSVAEAVVSGVPSSAGTYSFSVQASDSAGVVGVANCTMTVFPAGESLRIEPWGASSNVNFNLWPTTTYSVELNALGGRGGYEWRLKSGALPQGLFLHQDGEQHASIAGRITQTGTYVFELQVVDRKGNRYTSAITLDVVDIVPP